MIKQNLQLELITEPILKANGVLSTIGLNLPKNLTEKQWENIGRELGRFESAHQWWIGDWWAFGKHGYGDRKELVESETWTGPAYGTCANAAPVCEAFESSRRRDNLTFSHHVAVYTLCTAEADALLDECEEQKLTIRRLRERVKQVKAYLAQGWTKSQLQRKAKAEAGEIVLANMTPDEHDVPIDNALITWAESQDLAMRIDRQSAPPLPS